MAISLVGSALTNWISGTSSASTVITANATNLIVVVEINFEINATGGAPTTANVSDTSGLTWHNRQRFACTPSGPNKACVIDRWWAYSAASLSNNSIHTGLSGTVDNGATVVAAFSGIPSGNYSNPWDTNTSLPALGNNVVISGNIPCNIGPYSTSSQQSVVIYSIAAATQIDTTGQGSNAPFSWIKKFRETGGINYWEGQLGNGNVIGQTTSQIISPATFSGSGTGLSYIDALVQLAAATTPPPSGGGNGGGGNRGGNGHHGGNQHNRVDSAGAWQPRWFSNVWFTAAMRHNTFQEAPLPPIVISTGQFITGRHGRRRMPL